MSLPLAAKRVKTATTSSRGAIFGLDARLTLLILAALSVVVGTAGIQQMRQAHYTRVYQDLQAIEAAFVNLYRDTQVFPLFSNVGTGEAQRLAQLYDTTYVAPSLSNRWQGPYLHVSPSQLGSGYIYTYALGANTLTFGVANDADCSNINNANCLLTVQITGAPLALAEFLNDHVDEASGGFGSTTIAETTPQADGRLTWTGSGPYTIFYHTRIRRHQ